MTNKYFVFEFRHCWHEWKTLAEKSRCRTCRKMVKAWSKELTSSPEKKESFINKFKDVFK